MSTTIKFLNLMKNARLKYDNIDDTINSLIFELNALLHSEQSKILPEFLKNIIGVLQYNRKDSVGLILIDNISTMKEYAEKMAKKRCCECGGELIVGFNQTYFWKNGKILEYDGETTTKCNDCDATID